ncbi:hypothetical protein [Acidianus ambivalens]|uniref:Uncharacterized protein n=1 Tax=Acidianus ambivalens TaxID=2283 RepID=A0A650CU21_ACIAM|nr:hypothetical protein [Acidianus ambivalens]MQL56152.1 hypothetical protein [Acidianus ambivalens]QGR21306.1 hypothetical protein D1866_04325 [Acidianus ambivalens]
MQNSVTGSILLIATIVASLSVFGIYFAYTSVYSPQVANQEYLISLSKVISASISEDAFKGIPPSYKGHITRSMLHSNSKNILLESRNLYNI